jgi:WD40 repeat protein
MSSKNLDIFHNFISSNKHLLVKGDNNWPTDKILFQLAYEHGEDSPISKQADNFLEQERVEGSWFKLLNRMKHSSKNPNYYTFDLHDSDIRGFKLINSEIAVSWEKDETWSSPCKDPAFFIWNLKTFEYKKLQIGINIADLIKINDDIVCVYSDNKSVSPESNVYVDDYDKLIIINITNGDKYEFYFEAQIISVIKFELNLMIYIYDDKTSLSKLISLDTLNRTTQLITDASIKYRDFRGNRDFEELSLHECYVTNQRKLKLKQLFCIKISEGSFLSITNKSLELFKFINGKWCKINQKEINYLPTQSGDIEFEILDNENIIFIVAMHDISVLFHLSISTLKITRLRFRNNNLKIQSSSVLLGDYYNAFFFKLFDDLYVRLENLNDKIEIINIDTIMFNYKYLKKDDVLYQFIDLSQNQTSSALIKTHNRIAITYNEKTLFTYNQNKQVLKKLEGHTDSVKGVHIINNSHALSWSDDTTLRLWNLETGSSKVFKGHSSFICDVQLSGPNHAISLSEDDDLRLWELNTGSSKYFRGHSSLGCSGFKLLNDNHMVSYSCLDRTIRLWDLDNGYLDAIQDSYIIEGCVTLKDNKSLLWSSDGKIIFLDLNEMLNEYSIHLDKINGVKLLEENQFISWSDDKTIKLFNSSGKILNQFTKHKNKVNNIELLDGNKVLSWSDDNTMMLWSLDDDSYIELDKKSAPIKLVCGIDKEKCISVHSKYMSDKHILRLWNLNNGQSLVFDEATEVFHFIRINTNIFISVKNNYISVFEVALDINLKYRCHVEYAAFLSKYIIFEEEIIFINSDSISMHDGDLFESSEIFVYNFIHNTLKTHSNHSATINNIIKISSNEFVTCSEDSTVRLWNTYDYATYNFNLHTSSVNGLKLIKKDVIASFSSNGTIAIQNFNNGNFNIFKEHYSSIMSLLLVNETSILSWDSDGTIILWSYNLASNPKVKCKYFLERISRIEKITSKKFICFLGTGEHKIIKLENY